MKNLKLSTTVHLLIMLVFIVISNTSNAQLTTNNGSLFFQNNKQRFQANGTTDLRYYSNHENQSYLSLYNNQNIRLGRLYGSMGEDGSTFFGLSDADGNWSYMAKTDEFTAFRINNESKMTLQKNGNVGIGFTAPQTKLEVKGTIRAASKATRNNRTEMGHTGAGGFINTVGVGNLFFQHDGKNIMRVQDDGKIAIGNVNTFSNNYTLFVEKGILSEKIRVSIKNSDDWADYVFAEDYELMPITELENYITENQHLPNVPSTEEVVENGIDMAKMDATLLEKIEELTLYVIHQQKEIEGLKTQINKKH